MTESSQDPKWCGQCKFFSEKEQDDDGVWHGKCWNEQSPFYRDLKRPDTTADDRELANDCYTA